MNYMKGRRFFLVKESPKGGGYLQIRYLDNLRVNCDSTVDADDDHEFALALLEGISTQKDARDITLCVFAEPIHYKETAVGFEYGAAEVMRVASNEQRGWVVVEVQSPKSNIRVYVTKTGKIRLYRDGEEV